MTIALAASRLALGAGLIAVLVSRVGCQTPRCLTRTRRNFAMALGSLALGLAIFALFYGLVAACDRL